MIEVCIVVAYAVFALTSAAIKAFQSTLVVVLVPDVVFDVAAAIAAAVVAAVVAVGVAAVVVEPVLLTVDMERP